MSVAIGTPVARAVHGVIHLARVSQPDGVMALCGNLIARPRTTGLLGAECPTCRAIQRPASAPYHQCSEGHRTPYAGGPTVIPCPYRIAALMLCSRTARVPMT